MTILRGGRPFWRGFQFIIVTFGLAYGYITFGSFINWPPFFKYPSLGSPQWVLIWIFALGFAWFIDFARFFHLGKGKTDQQIQQGQVR